MRILVMFSVLLLFLILYISKQLQQETYNGLHQTMDLYAKQLSGNMKTAEDCLWEFATIAAIADGTVDLLATDNAPHTLAEKELGFLEAPNGIIGLECAYGVCHKVLVDGGFISDERLIELMSVGPAELMGHVPTDVAALVEDYAEPAPTGDDPDGVIAGESDAQPQREGVNRLLDLSRVDDADNVDLVVLNAAEEWTVDPEQFHSKARNTPFGGWQVTGRPLATIIGSQLMFSRL